MVHITTRKLILLASWALMGTLANQGKYPVSNSPESKGEVSLPPKNSDKYSTQPGVDNLEEFPEIVDDRVPEIIVDEPESDDGPVDDEYTPSGIGNSKPGNSKDVEENNEDFDFPSELEEEDDDEYSKVPKDSNKDLDNGQDSYSGSGGSGVSNELPEIPNEESPSSEGSVDLEGEPDEEYGGSGTGGSGVYDDLPQDNDEDEQSPSSLGSVNPNSNHLKGNQSKGSGKVPKDQQFVDETETTEDFETNDSNKNSSEDNFEEESSGIQGSGSIDLDNYKRPNNRNPQVIKDEDGQEITTTVTETTSRENKSSQGNTFDSNKELYDEYAEENENESFDNENSFNGEDNYSDSEDSEGGSGLLGSFGLNLPIPKISIPSLSINAPYFKMGLGGKGGSSNAGLNVDAPNFKLNAGSNGLGIKAGGKGGSGTELRVGGSKGLGLNVNSPNFKMNAGSNGLDINAGGSGNTAYSSSSDSDQGYGVHVDAPKFKFNLG